MLCGGGAVSFASVGSAETPAAGTTSGCSGWPRAACDGAGEELGVAGVAGARQGEVGRHGHGEPPVVEGAGAGVAQHGVEADAAGLHALQDELPGALDALQSEFRLRGPGGGHRWRRAAFDGAVWGRDCVAGVRRGPGRGRAGRRRGRAGLEAPQALLERGRRVVELRPRDLDQRQLELQPRIEAVADLALGLAQHLDEVDDLARGQVVGLGQQASEQLVVQLDRLSEGAQGGVVARRLLEVLQQEELPQVAQQVADELRVVGAVVGQALHELQGLGRAPFGDDVGDLEEQVGVGDAECFEHVGRLDAPSE